MGHGPRTSSPVFKTIVTSTSISARHLRTAYERDHSQSLRVPRLPGRLFMAAPISLAAQRVVVASRFEMGIKLAVLSVRLKQRAVCALFEDPSILKHHDATDMADRRQTVCDHQRCLAAHQA